eukprot:6189005-Alexandrium_andersonii.AAC.1
MSASLVGSEMCIRDRRVALRTWLPRGEDASSLGGHLNGRAPHGQEAPPVSYTHLTLPTICSV